MGCHSRFHFIHSTALLSLLYIESALMKFSSSKWIACLFIAMNLSACGGGGGGGDESGSPEGVYEGTSSTGEYFNTIVLENNLFYTIYGDIVNDVFVVEGFFTGTGKVDGRKFSADNVRDFDASGLDGGGTLTAIFKAGESFNGSTSGGATFNASRPEDTSYNYNSAAKLSNIAGTWTMNDLSLTTVTLDIAADGNYTASYDGGNCEFEGRFIPRASGKNVFDVSVAGGGGASGFTCNVVVPGTAGHAVEFLLPGGQRQLIIAGTDDARESGTLLIGAR